MIVKVTENPFKTKTGFWKKNAKLEKASEDFKLFLKTVFKQEKVPGNFEKLEEGSQKILNDCKNYSKPLQN
jgi:hypothetical protein